MVEKQKFNFGFWMLCITSENSIQDFQAPGYASSISKEKSSSSKTWNFFFHEAFLYPDPPTQLNPDPNP
jgi:hypothetical protein